MAPRRFRVGVSSDFRSAGSQTSWGDIGLGVLEREGVAWDFLAQDDGALAAEDVAGYDAILFAAPSITAATVSGPATPLLFARFGVGLDAVDLPACTASGSAVTITPDGARRAVATAALTLMLAVNQRLIEKHRLVVSGRWQDKHQLMGRGLTGLTVGTIGLGNVAVELFELLRPFRTVNLAVSPGRPDKARFNGVQSTGLSDLLARCDVVVVAAPLTPATHHLINAERLRLMKPGAIIINIARGAIIDTAALVEALRSGRLAGAGLDVFEAEPLPVDHPLTRMPNVVLSPHALAWTDEMAHGNGSSAVKAILAVRSGRHPAYLANPDVLRHPRFAGRRTDGQPSASPI